MSSGGKRPAPQKSLQPQPHAAPRAKSLDSFIGVSRTGRMKLAAAPEEGPEKNLIAAYACQCQPSEKSARAPALYFVARFSCGSKASNSVSSFENSSVSTDRLGCITTSHPGRISSRCNRKTSRMRLRIRLRTTALPNAFFTLIPKRSRSSPFARRKTRNVALDRRRPSRYTASNSDRRTSRHSRGKFFFARAFAPASAACSWRLSASGGPSNPREVVASFFAASRKDFLSTFGLHSRAEPMFLVPPPDMRLKRTLYQRIFSLNGCCSITRKPAIRKNARPRTVKSRP